MAASSTALCNIALRELRQQPITALTENSEAARLCNTFYADTLDELLALHPTNFALRRQQLAQQAATPTFEWTYGYHLPTDPYCLRAYKLWHNGRYYLRDWQVEGRTLYTDFDNDVYLLYVARVSDAAQFSPTFSRAFALKLAAQLAYPLTRDDGAAERMNKAYEVAWRRHRSTDSAEGFYDVLEDGAFVAIRE